jgi:hypothetical protein
MTMVPCKASRGFWVRRRRSFRLIGSLALLIVVITFFVLPSLLELPGFGENIQSQLFLSRYGQQDFTFHFFGLAGRPPIAYNLATDMFVYIHLLAEYMAGDTAPFAFCISCANKG